MTRGSGTDQPPESDDAKTLKRLKLEQRGDRNFALLMSFAVFVLTTWFASRALDGHRAALAIGVLLAVGTFWAMTRRLRADVRAVAQPIPEWWQETLDDALPYFRFLGQGARHQFLRRIQIFLASQRITGIDCEVTDEDRLLLAAAAAVLVEGFPEFRWPTTRELLIYPTAFDSSYQLDQQADRVGEMLEGGPIIFTLPELRRGFTDEDWSNVAIHELAHYFDGLRSTAPGSFESEFDSELQALLEDPQLQMAILNEQSPIDDYALEDRQEFFAVCSEVFFEDPLLLRQLHPRVYEWLVGVYRQNPAETLDGR